MKIEIKPKNIKALKEYCEANDITDFEAFCNRCLMQGLTILMYGTSPIDNIEREIQGIKDIKKARNNGTRKTTKSSLDKADESKDKPLGDVKEGGSSKEESVKPQEIKEPQVIKSTVRKIQIIKKS